jgi:hypothetical protein
MRSLLAATLVVLITACGAPQTGRVEVRNDPGSGQLQCLMTACSISSVRPDIGLHGRWLMDAAILLPNLGSARYFSLTATLIAPREMLPAGGPARLIITADGEERLFSTARHQAFGRLDDMNQQMASPGEDHTAGAWRFALVQGDLQRLASASEVLLRLEIGAATFQGRWQPQHREPVAELLADCPLGEAAP